MTTKKITRIDKELDDELQKIKKQIYIDLNVDITSADASKILIKKYKKTPGKIIIKKTRKRGIINIQ